MASAKCCLLSLGLNVLKIDLSLWLETHETFYALISISMMQSGYILLVRDSSTTVTWINALPNWWINFNVRTTCVFTKSASWVYQRFWYGSRWIIDPNRTADIPPVHLACRHSYALVIFCAVGRALASLRITYIRSTVHGTWNKTLIKKHSNSFAKCILRVKTVLVTFHDVL